MKAADAAQAIHCNFDLGGDSFSEPVLVILASREYHKKEKLRNVSSVLNKKENVR